MTDNAKHTVEFLQQRERQSGDAVEYAADEIVKLRRAVEKLKADNEALLDLVRKQHVVLGEAREMLGVMEDHGGHDGIGGKGYLATLDHIDQCRRAGMEAIAQAEEKR